MEDTTNKRLWPSLVIGVLWYLTLMEGFLPFEGAPTYFDLFKLSMEEEIGTFWKVLLGAPTAILILLSVLHFSFGKAETIRKGYVTTAGIFTILIYLIYFSMFSLSASLLESILIWLFGYLKEEVSPGPIPLLYLGLSVAYLVFHLKDKSNSVSQPRFQTSMQSSAPDPDDHDEYV